MRAGRPSGRQPAPCYGAGVRGTGVVMAWAAALTVAVALGCHHDAPAPAVGGAPEPRAITAVAATPAPSARAMAADQAPDVPSPGDHCDRDADCVATNFPGCCACPQCSVASPVARSVSALRAAEAACRVAACDPDDCAVGGMCPPGEPASHFRARCVDHACVLVRP